MRGNDTYEAYTVKSAKETRDGRIELSFDDSSGMLCRNPGNLPLPRPGQTAKLYGRGFGYPIRGVEIGPHVYYYETEDEYRKRFEREQVEKDRRDRVEFDKNIADFNRRIRALPNVLQVRVERFMQRDGWGHRFGGYEMFVCEQAAVIADSFPDRAAIAAFAKLPWDEQKDAVDGLDDGHSGNTFGAACRLAAAIKDCDEEIIVKMHGALCPLVGCKEYGCWAAENGAPDER